MATFDHRGLYLDSNGQVRCSCNNRQCGDWQKYNFERHFDTAGHKKFETDREAERIHQASFDELAAKAAREESERLQAAGTRSTHNVDADRPFRERFVEMMMRVGIPLNKAEKMKPWVEKECKRSIGNRTDLAGHIPELLKKEEELQESILKGIKYISIIFDATPRQGDFFALIARMIVLNPETKRAVANQQLIHCAAIKGSLNANTLAGEVSNGLQNRRIKNDQAVAAMQDGCYTNGAAHDMMNEIAGLAGGSSRFISTCLSHCASNAGTFYLSLCLTVHSLILFKFVSYQTHISTVNP